MSEASQLPLLLAPAVHHSWQCSLQSPRSFSGQCQTLPCEPPPLAQCAFQGLNKAQQMIAIQAIGLPAIPAYDVNDGGVVCLRPETVPDSYLI